ncbi:MAG: hypothetical protein O2912_05965 [Proteobacteria bacterium]|nr:hypothetical protein [Pseudomonadota bacterium]
METKDYINYLALGSLAVAILAFLRPELEKLLSKWVNAIAIYPSSLVEIGFSSFGPTIGIAGTLFASHRNQLVQSISLDVVRQRDNATHKFEWLLFRDLDYLQMDRSKIDVATAFVVGRDASKPFNILFNDSRTLDLFRDDLMGLQNLFRSFCNEQQISAEIFDNESWYQAHEKFVQSSETDTSESSIYSKMKDIFYWEPGDYSFSISIMTDKPDKTFRSNYSFHLSDVDSQALTLNIIKLMQIACFFPTEKYEFANPTLSKQ